MKLLTVAIPVYNTENYINRCLDSILVNDILDYIEVIAVNDGSMDNSINILQKYKKKYPDSLIIINKENGGHGSTINAALNVATGKYFRVLDSDDWFDSENFVNFVNKLKTQDADLIITNYRKEHIYNGLSEYIEWTRLKENLAYNADRFNIKLLNKDYFVMANSTYKTKILKKSGLRLLEKTFYVDMQYNVIPIAHIKTFAYINLDIYRYFIGRPDQSMNLQNFVKNRANHEKVMKFLVEYYTENFNSFSKNKQKYIEQILFYMLTTHYYIYCVYAKSNRKAVYTEIKSFDKYLKCKNLPLYKLMNKVPQIKYNRKTNFIFVKINSQFFSKFISICGTIVKRRA